jgi:HEAT repeat protein
MFFQIYAKARQKFNNKSSTKLQTHLGQLAFHMELDKRIDLIPDEITVGGLCSQKQAISWLFDGPRWNNSRPIQLTKQEQVEGEQLLDDAEKLGFITKAINKAVRFSSLELQRHFFALHLFKQPFGTILTRAASPHFPWFCHLWMEHDSNLIDKLIAAATASSTGIDREYAIKVLKYLGDSQAVEPLIRLLRETDFPRQVRSSAAYALAALGDRRAIKPLIESFKEPAFGSSFYLDMQSLGEEAFSALLAALRSEDALVRERAAGSLGRFNDKRAVDFLIDALQDNNQKVRQGAICSLGMLGDKQAVEPVLSVLNTPRDIVNGPILDALNEFEAKEAVPKLIAGLEWIISQGNNDDWEEVIYEVVRSLEIVGFPGKILEIMLSDPASAQLIQASNYVVDDLAISHIQRQLEAAVQSNDHKKAEKIIRSLGSLTDEQVVPILLKWLPEYPKAAIYSLADVGDSQHVNILLPYLNHTDRRVRSECILSLISLRDEKEIEPLIHVLQHDSDNFIRSFAASALDRFSPPLVIPALHSALKDSDAKVRISAIKALNDLRDLTALPLLEALQQTDTERVGEAVWVIAELAIRNLQGDPSSARPLAK